ncbi:uncharacterized protein LOC124114746 [Haliotis rufescens]|uniref:uncharacterized protein LOC124114746 n=1 Tax=Haliotis rufescens TaxID=6454 RepID=UPI00201E7C48|nr:uncharacterized protein LOC124114746 [Haliotis rufescens]
MGNLHLRGSYHSNKDEDKCSADFHKRILSAKSGQLLHTCSFGKWIRHRRKICGFTGKTDFSTLREAHRRSGILVKPDTTDGRYFAVSWKSKSEIVILEKLAWWVGSVKVPRVPVPDTEDPNWFRHAQHNRTRKECSVVGYRNGLAVVQINCDRHFTIAKFYILDLFQKTCVGHFVVMYHTRRWYECYISPNKRRIMLRPDHLTRVVVLPDSYVIQNLTLFVGPSESPVVAAIPPAFRTHALTYNTKLGDDFVILGADQDIEIRKLPDWSLEKHVPNLNISASIHQIRSSPTGDFIAIRYVHPIHSREYSTNFVAVLSYPKLDIVMRVDVRGCYWPVSEVINLQVFPRFSPSESCIAVMRNCSYKRKVFVYKLPPVQSSLQHLCRRTVLQLVPLKDTEKLPLPNKLLDYLQFREKTTAGAF